MTSLTATTNSATSRFGDAVNSQPRKPPPVAPEHVSSVAVWFCLIVGFILAAVTTGLIVWPIATYTDQLELSGKMHFPDWLVAPVALLILGCCFGLTRVYALLLGRLFGYRR
jgi:hypothetical protein